MSRFGACSARTSGDTHTHRQTDRHTRPSTAFLAAHARRGYQKADIRRPLAVFVLAQLTIHRELQLTGAIMAGGEVLRVLVVLLAAAAAVDAQGMEMHHSCLQAPRLNSILLLETIVVGFERTLYTITEGGSASICVEIISPQDIGNAVVYLEVVASVPQGAVEASKNSLLKALVLVSYYL